MVKLRWLRGASIARPGVLSITALLSVAACSGDSKDDGGARGPLSESQIDGNSDSNDSSAGSESNTANHAGGNSAGGTSPNQPTQGGSGGSGSGGSGGSGGSTPNQNDPAQAGAGGVTSSSCIENEKHCIHGEAHVCTNGVWIFAGTCAPDPMVCADGSIPVDGGCPDTPVKDECTPQAATYTGLCKPAPLFYWNGQSCEGRSGCACAGADCDTGFARYEDCEATFAGCGGKICGGFAGFTCTQDQYCAYQPGQYCGAADASSTCKERPMACTEQYSPVCGCDNKTYSNACFANAAGTGILSAGQCAQ